MPSIQEALSQGVVIFDGAMGTEIYRHHVFTNRCFDELSLSEPAMIRRIHASYREAGAEVLTTNTFGANRIALANFGLADKLADIHRAAARLAREVADAGPQRLFVAGSIGPLPAMLPQELAAESLIKEQAEALIEGGVDFILFETQPDRSSLERCAAAMRSLPEVPYVLSFAIVERGETTSGESVDRMMSPLPEGCPSPVAWSMNCGSGPDGLLGAVERAVRLTTLPLVVMPNAGMPKEVGNRRIYLCSPEYLATYAKRYVELGAAAVGGCCGTTPEHIAEAAEAVKPLARGRRQAIAVQPAETAQQKPPAPFADKSRWARCLARRQWVVSIELLPRAVMTWPTRSARASGSIATGSTRSTFPTAPGRVLASPRCSLPIGSSGRHRLKPFCISAAATGT